MATTIEMPKLSDTMTVGTLVRWLKKEGEPVATGEMIAEVETDKATMELEAFDEGILLKQHVKEGDQVPVGTPIAAIGKKGESIPEAAAPAEKPAGKPEQPVSKQAPAEGDKPQPTPETPVSKAEARDKAPPARPDPSPSDAPAQQPSAEPDARVRISPLAKKIAQQRGISLAGLKGTGPGGRIVKADVLAAGERGSPAAAAAGPSVALLSGTVGKRGPVAEEKTTAVSNMRATIARRLVEAKTQIPHFYVEAEIDAAPLVELRATLNAALEKEGVKVSLNDFVLKASAEALRRVPAVNCSWEGDSVRQHGSAHVSFAVAIDEGLITPVVREAQDKTVFQIAAEVKSLAARAKNRKLKPDEFTGGTFCVSNLGMMGVDRFSAIINPPNAAILAVGAALKKAVVNDRDEIVAGTRMSLTLSCDHRVVDGATGALYLAALKQLLERPALLLL